MQPKWSCKQALSLSGRKGTEEKKMYQSWKKGEGWREIKKKEEEKERGKKGKEQEVYLGLTH